MGHNELLIHEALAGRKRDAILISVKLGALRDPMGGWAGYDGRPQAVRNFLAYSLARLGTDHVDIYRPTRLDPTCRSRRCARTLCATSAPPRVGPETIRRAHAVHPIADLQIEYSLISRSIEAAILPTCRELGIGITAYGVLSRGLLSGHWSSQRAGTGDSRHASPRFQGANLEHNLGLVEALRTVAQARGATTAQVATAWVLSRGPDIVPLVGARRRDSLAESLGALELGLSADDLAAIERAVR